MTRRIVLVLLATLTLSVAAPRPASAGACFPGLQFLCDLFDADLLIKSATSRLKIGIDSFLLQLKLQHGQKLSQAEATLEMAGGLRSAQNDVNRMFIPGPTGASCAIASAASSYLSGGTGGQLPPSAYTSPPGTGHDPTLDRGTAKPMGSFRTASGGRRPASAAVKDMGDTSKIDAATLGNQYTKAADAADTDCRNNLPAGSECENQWKKVQADFIERMNFYGPDQKQSKFVNADIMASTLLSVDTLATDENNTATSTGKYIDSTGKVSSDNSIGNAIQAVTGEAAYPTKNMIDAARDFCHNLTDPTILAPNRGAAKAQDGNRQAHAVQRAGWDARLSLASTICNEAVARRLPKDYQSTDTSGSTLNGGMLIQLMQEIRKKTCDQTGNKAANLNCGDQADQNNVLANVTQFSDYEALKTLMTKLMASDLSAQHAGGSNNSEALKQLVQADELTVMMNYRIYELQERLNLVKAAQLAQQVENERTDPGPSSPTQ